MRGIILGVMLCLASPALAQLNAPSAATSKSSMNRYKILAFKQQQLSAAFPAYLGGIRADAINAHPGSSYIPRGDASEAAAISAEPGASASSSAAAAMESQADAAFAAGNYPLAVRLYGQAGSLWDIARRDWSEVNRDHAGAVEAYRLASFRP